MSLLHVHFLLAQIYFPTAQPPVLTGHRGEGLLCLSPPSGACVEGGDQSFRCQIAGPISRSLLHFIFLRQGLLLNLELPVSSAQGSSCLHASSQHWELQTPPTTLRFYLSAEASDSEPHACIAGRHLAVCAGPTLQPRSLCFNRAISQGRQ